MIREIIFFFFLFAAQASAIAVGVVPDRLVFGEEGGWAQQAMIVNPNNSTIGYNVTSRHVLCDPANGEIEPKRNARLTCRAIDNSTAQDTILFETTGGDNAVGVMPAVAIMVEIEGGGGGAKTYENESFEKQNNALEIAGGDDNSDGESGNQSIVPARSVITPEICTVALLCVAIISVMAYSEIRDRREIGKKEKEKDNEKKKN